MLYLLLYWCMKIFYDLNRQQHSTYGVHKIKRLIGHACVGEIACDWFFCFASDEAWNGTVLTMTCVYVIILFEMEIMQDDCTSLV